MKKVSTFIVFNMLVIFGILAQPTYNIKIPPVGYVSSENFYILKNGNPGLGGANQTWSFTLPDTIIFKSKFDFILPSATAYSDSFPGATVVIKSTTESDSFPTLLLEYYKVQNNLAEIIGSVFKVDPTISFTKYQNPETVIWPSVSYNQSVSDNYSSTTKQEISPGQFFTDSAFGSRTLKYDGYGSISTPFGFFGNVFRLKEQYLERTETFGEAAKRTTNYLWVKAGPIEYEPIFSLSFDTTLDDEGQNQTSIYALTKGPTTSNKSIISNLEFSVFPNPFTDKLTVKTDFKNGGAPLVSLFDVAGKELKNIEILRKDENGIDLNTNHLRPGFYTIKLIEGTIQKTFRVTKE